MTGSEIVNFKLTEGEKRSPLWIRFRAHMEARLEQARRQNDGPLPPDQTAALRGQINCLKGLTALGNDEPPIDG